MLTQSETRMAVFLEFNLNIFQQKYILTLNV